LQNGPPAPKRSFFHGILLLFSDGNMADSNSSTVDLVRKILWVIATLLTSCLTSFGNCSEFFGGDVLADVFGRVRKNCGQSSGHFHWIPVHLKMGISPKREQQLAATLAEQKRNASGRANPSQLSDFPIIPNDFPYDQLTFEPAEESHEIPFLDRVVAKPIHEKKNLGITANFRIMPASTIWKGKSARLARPTCRFCRI
jgi:hypothetical protein